MKLKDIKTWVTVPPSGIGGSFWVIVKITTDNGIEGIGECYGIPVSGDIACAMVEDTFERFVAGEDPHHIETLFRRVYSADVYHDAAAAAERALEYIDMGFTAIKQDPTEPGLGIELNEKVLEDHPYTSGGRLHLEMCQSALGSANEKIITDID